MTQHVTHEVLATHAKGEVNVASDVAQRRRAQVNHLRTRLESYIAANPDYDLVKLRSSGSTAKHTAIRALAGGGSDADVAAYVTASNVGGISAPEAGLLQWLKERCEEVYGATKDAEDFQISHHAVGITMHDSKLKIDVAPVLYGGEANDRGYLVTRQGDRVLTSVTQHLTFINARAAAAGPGYKELIRLLKAWVSRCKYEDEDFRFKSFLLELMVAQLWDTGWNGQGLEVNDYPRAIEQVLSYVVRTGLKDPVAFTDCYPAAALPACTDPVQVWDPVNENNNVARSYTEADRQRLVERAANALEQVSWAAMAPTRSAANDAWRTLFGPSFRGA